MTTEFRGILTTNGRQYSPAVLRRAVETFNERAQDKPFFGQLEPHPGRLDLGNVSHVVEKMEVRPDGAVIATVKTLDTKAGRTLEAMLGAGVNIGISMRGTALPPEDIITVVARLADDDAQSPDTMKITSVDIVVTPENPDARVHSADV